MHRRIAPNGAETIRQGNSVRQIMVYKHPWEMVLEGYLRRFPTHPKMPMVIRTYQSDHKEEPEQGRLTYKRFVEASAKDVPWIIRKATGFKSIVFDAHVTEDYRNRTMTVVSENVSLRKRVLLDETTVYMAHADNPDYTYFEQTATISIPGLPTSVANKLSSFLAKEYEDGIDQGRVVDQELVDQLYTEGKRETDPEYKPWSLKHPDLEAALSGGEAFQPRDGGGVTAAGSRPKDEALLGITTSRSQASLTTPDLASVNQRA
eukprot:COSAG01_NODE_14051_length_1502_cov_1.338560_1_plen_262_part_00